MNIKFITKFNSLEGVPCTLKTDREISVSSRIKEQTMLGRYCVPIKNNSTSKIITILRIELEN